MCDWISRNVEHSVDKIIMKSFLKTEIIIALDGSEDDMFWVEMKNMDVEGDGESAPESSSEDNNSDEQICNHIK
jgi:hypothetical protein